MLAMGPFTTLLVRKYFMDDLYMKGIVLPVRDKVSAFVYWTNQNVLDGIVNGAARLARWFSRGVHGFDQTVVDGAVNGVAQTAGFTGGLLRYLQSGNVQRYAALLFAGVVVLAVIFTRV
jgi:NADH-quinone oxidoreductase subunit L